MSADYSLPDLTGRNAVVTGADDGIGLEVTRRLVLAGANAVMAVFDAERGRDEAAAIRAENPRGKISVERLNLASLASVDEFAEEMAALRRPLDLLVGYSPLGPVPERLLTANNFELQMGVQHFGPFALVGRLLPLLRRAASPRVVTVSDPCVFSARIDLDDLDSARSYRPRNTFAQAKLADLLYALELDRRSVRNGWRLTSTAVLPGKAGLRDRLPFLPNRSDPARVALPVLYAATSPDARGGEIYGLAGGAPARVRPPRRAQDPDVAARLWRLSEELTGVVYGQDTRSEAEGRSR
ncbi:SDR family NAD(P)-dependent oxidoreductase [Actinocorallia longicatena]|uniref:SDR family oxidoreductase n=1 Tax=Actinocorallia longicatena TaxID=111803 RepID=A0ABP6Q644_9ACTN